MYAPENYQFNDSKQCICDLYGTLHMERKEIITGEIKCILSIRYLPE